LAFHYLVIALKVPFLTVLALCAFAGNSILCRIALSSGETDPASFTLVRLLAAAFTLLLILHFRSQYTSGLVSSSVLSKGSWKAAAMLFGYAIFFASAYAYLDTGTGALILFASVQMTMIIKTLIDGDNLTSMEWIGAITAFAGFVLLVAPGVSAPPFLGLSLMTLAGVSWGFYTLVGKQSTDAVADTAFNFIKSTPMALIVFLLWPYDWQWSTSGLLLSGASGALTSGVGYAIWYTVLPLLKPVQAAVVQLAVPFIAAGGGVLLVGEVVSIQLLLSAAIVSAGIGIVLLCRVKFSGSKS
jgi:drug/metabolite transporter (DMT)-like permease